MPGQVRPSRKPRTQRLALILATSAILFSTWHQWPQIQYQWRLYRAEGDLKAGRLDEAEDRLDLLIVERPMQTWPRFLRAQVARKRGQITEAEELLQRAVELGLSVDQARLEHDLLVNPAVGEEARLTAHR